MPNLAWTNVTVVQNKMPKDKFIKMFAGDYDLRDLEFKKDQILFSTETAWSPPREWLQKVADVTRGDVVAKYTIEGESEWEHDGDEECTIDSEEHDYECDYCTSKDIEFTDIFIPRSY